MGLLALDPAKYTGQTFGHHFQCRRPSWHIFEDKTIVPLSYTVVEHLFRLFCTCAFL